jgi:hypothetical protein
MAQSPTGIHRIRMMTILRVVPIRCRVVLVIIETHLYLRLVAYLQCHVRTLLTNIWQICWSREGPLR